MKLYTVIDTNVLVSALISKNSDSATIEVVKACLDGRITPLIHDEILHEYSDVLHRPKFHFNNEIVSYIISAFTLYGMKVLPTPSGEDLPDKEDLIFYEVALTKQTDNAFLVTGNLRHYPNKIFIVSPAEMVEIIEQSR